MADTYTFEIGHPDHSKNHTGRKLIAQAGKVMVHQLLHNKVPGDRIHVPKTIPAGDYSLVSGDVQQGGNFEVTIESGPHT
jgi:hypothetical protein